MSSEYRVLARKYRPTTFDDLVGQEAMVTVLSNAFAQNRIAHAFMLTGLRGIGKTTTARIIARALNCTGIDGKNTSPTIAPCGVCDNCRAIAEDKHPDVLEMDAASHTSIDDVRELMKTMQYRPVQARYKVYIIDEVHMLSTSAFNALLKTLEEPPPAVKFIFATTDSHKVSVTVLSRCQRFDLKRLSVEALAQHLMNIASKEGLTLTAEAAPLLARAAEGSVRDGLSLLDQAIAMAADAPVSLPLVQDMLGLAHRRDSLQLLAHTLEGNVEAALTQAQASHQAGSDPLMLLKELLELVHVVTRLKTVPTLCRDMGLSPEESLLAQRLAGQFGVPILTRAWQILLKGYEEAKATDYAYAAVEMVLIRLAYVSDLPSPEALVKRLQSGDTTPMPPRVPLSSSASPVMASRGQAQVAVNIEGQPENATVNSFLDVVALCIANKESMLAFHLRHHARLVTFRQGYIELHVLPDAPKDILGQLTRHLQGWTGERWLISASQKEGGATLHAQEQSSAQAQKEQIEQHPLVQAALKTFPDAKIIAINTKGTIS